MALKDLLENWALNGLTDREIYNDEYDRKIKLLIKDLAMVLDIIDSLVVGSSATLLDTGLTLWASPVIGEVGYMTGVDNTLARAKADSINTSLVYGVYIGTAGSVCVDGIVNVLFEPGLTLIAGQKIYLSATMSGRATNIEPLISGDVSVELGLLKNKIGYNSMTGSALPINWYPKDPIIIP